MIELPERPGPNGASPTHIDFGIDLVPPTGGRELRVDRPGNRFSIDVSYPPMPPEVARIFVSRLLAAKSEGVRIEYPLLDVVQGSPGNPVVDGAGQAGTTLNVRGMAPHYRFKEGYGLSIEDENGQHYLHNCRANGAGDGAGVASLSITPALRHPFLDGAKVHLGKPMIEGRPVGSEWSWQIPVNRLIALSVTIKETA